LSTLDYLVIDEADLILSYGHSSDDIRALLSGASGVSTTGGGGGLPKVYQSFLMSATLTGEVEELKGVVLKNPVRFSFSSLLRSVLLSRSVLTFQGRMLASGRIETGRGRE
jgi:ATP-dependent RNA helicase DDX56/DBP9